MEQQRPLFMVFIDFTKAFDIVNRELLWKLLDHFGCPNTFNKIICEFHEGMQATVLVDGDLTKPFLYAMVLSKAVSVFWHQLSLGSIWLMSWKLPLITFVMVNVVFTYDHGQMASFSTWPVSEQSPYALKCVLQELLYADDSTLVAQSLEDLQAMLDRFVTASVAFGLTINISKQRYF